MSAIFPKLDAAKTHLNRAEETSPAGFLGLFQTRKCRINSAEKERTNVMNSPIQLKTTTPLLFLMLVLACFGLWPRALATDLGGVLAGNNTADGSGVLISLTTGVNNSGFGFQALFSDTDGSYNTATGFRALYSNTDGVDNSAIGNAALFHNTTGYNNTAAGFKALYSNTAGYDNTAYGYQTLYSNTSGSFNTANGINALYYNTTGTKNTATGFDALLKNTTGTYNTASGGYGLFSNTTGYNNTATGGTALYSNTTGIYNTATGASALYYNTTGARNTANGSSTLFYNTASDNTATGYQALLRNTTGDANTATGDVALYSNTNGGGNTADGRLALYSNTSGSQNTAVGYQALQQNTGSQNIALGWAAGDSLTTGRNNIDIGNQGVAAESNTIRIGDVSTQSRVFIAGTGAAVSGAVLYVNTSSGQIGTAASSARFKDEIKLMDKASETILALRPVTFRYKKEIDPQRVPQFGLVAEDVAKVDPDLVARDAKGEVYTVRYDVVNAMLLNEFLKEHRTVQELKQEIAALAATVKEQASQIQKGNARIEVTNPAPQVVLNNQ